MFKFKFVVPGPDALANEKYQQFKVGFVANAAALGFEVDDIDAVLAAASNFSDKLEDRNTAEVAFRNAVSAKDAARIESDDVIRSYVNRVLSDPAATLAMYTAMGIEPISSGVSPVVQPLELSATANADGTCRLKWNRNTNPSTTNFLIEASVEGGAWTWIGSTSRVSFTDESANPGVEKSYRVRAQRKGVTSTPSFSATIYNEDGESQLNAA